MPKEQHLGPSNPSVSAPPDRVLIHTYSLLFNLLLVLGRMLVLSTAPSIGIIFHCCSWLRGLVSWWYCVHCRLTLPKHETLIYEYETAPVSREQAEPPEKGRTSLTAFLQLNYSYFVCFNFMHTFH